MYLRRFLGSPPKNSGPGACYNGRFSQFCYFPFSSFEFWPWNVPVEFPNGHIFFKMLLGKIQERSWIYLVPHRLGITRSIKKVMRSETYHHSLRWPQALFGRITFYWTNARRLIRVYQNLYFLFFSKLPTSSG